MSLSILPTSANTYSRSPSSSQPTMGPHQLACQLQLSVRLNRTLHIHNILNILACPASCVAAAATVTVTSPPVTTITTTTLSGPLPTEIANGRAFSAGGNPPKPDPVLMNKVTGLVVSGHFPVVAVLAAPDVMRLELVKWEFEFGDEAIPMRYTF
jgi:hypothetical protein